MKSALLFFFTFWVTIEELFVSCFQINNIRQTNEVHQRPMDGNSRHGFQNFRTIHYHRTLIKTQASKGNSNDPEYPYSFSGRLWFRPSLVQTSDLPNSVKESLPPSVSIVSLFGWTIGGVVALEYDDSPVGPYREYVSMGAVVTKRGAIGQWGSRLFVNTKKAEKVCQDIWDVPAKLAKIDFLEGEYGQFFNGDNLNVINSPDLDKMSKVQSISVSGWKKTRVMDSSSDDMKRYPFGGIPVFWTPSIKALWAPLIPFPLKKNDNVNSLPLHKLRLSASAIRLRYCGQSSAGSLGIPIGVGLIVDNVLIEISDRSGSL